MKPTGQVYPRLDSHVPVRLIVCALSAAMWLGGCPADDEGSTAADSGVDVVKGPLPPDSEEQCHLKKTGYEGDDLCLLPPKEGTGMQLHAGPKNYDDPKDVEKFLLAPGKEVTECYYFTAPNEDHEYYFPRKIRMRPGSHHLITYIYGGAPQPEGWGPCGMEERRGSFGGAETTVVDYPTNNVSAPENEELIKFVPAHAQVKFEWHHINTTSKPILREAWINVYWKKNDPKKSLPLQDMFMIGFGINVPPHEKHIVHNECTIKGDTRIVDIFGHFHAHTTRFSAWRTRGGKSDLFYEVFDWHDTPTIAYDSATENAEPDRELLSPGGMSGQLDIKAGDVIEWECEIDNTTDGTLRIGNYVQTAEMCNLFGTYQSNSAALLMCRGTPTVTNLTAK